MYSWLLRGRIPRAFFWCSCFVFFAGPSCTKSVRDEVVVYQNDFEKGDLSNITNGTLSTFYGSQVLGNFNKGGFELKLDDLPEHEYVEVSFDLLIHDSWDGNNTGVDGPDFWKMTVDGQHYLTTTFVNRPCGGYDCYSQSYPNEYPFNNYARTTADPGELKGACVLGNEPQGSARYRFKRLIKHTAETFSMACHDELKQLNAAPDFQGCDESWSVDNMVIKVVKLK